MKAHLIKSIHQLWMPDLRCPGSYFSEYLAFYSFLDIQSTTPVACSCSSERSAFLQTRPQGLKLGSQKMRNIQLLTSCEKFGLNNLMRITQELHVRVRIYISRPIFNFLNYEATFFSLQSPASFTLNFPTPAACEHRRDRGLPCSQF